MTSNNNRPKVQIQSNSLRGTYMREIVNRTVNEIYADVAPMFGPGASDAVITKDGHPYYTRDGKEVMESLMFDNELANYVHHFLYQAAYYQGKDVGDGSTTLIMLYCNLYKVLIEDPEYLANMNINQIRDAWKKVTDQVVKILEERSVSLSDELLKSDLYTCTQDAELTAKIYNTLHDAIMAGAYIVPRKSNIATDFNVTMYHRPLMKVVRQFSLKAMEDEPENCVIFYCNGMMNLAHPEVLIAMSGISLNGNGGQKVRPNIIFLCHGITELTRETIRKYAKMVKDQGWDTNQLNNIAVYTLMDYRTMSPEELEDIGTIITDEPGLGGLVQPITFEALLYKSFVDTAALGIDPIEELELYDADLHLCDKMKNIFYKPHRLIFDEVEGMAIDKILGPVAQARYNELRKAIDEEKSSIKKVELNKRLRRTYGMFIDVEVGSTLLKDSQRKFELILDALISSTEAAKSGVLLGNSIIHAITAVRAICNEVAAGKVVSGEYNADCLDILCEALLRTIIQVITNYNHPNLALNEFITKTTKLDQYIPADFNLRGDEVWPEKNSPEAITSRESFIMVKNADGEDMKILNHVIEPVSVMKSILENSILAIELARTEVFHISGQRGFMGNYID